MSSEISHKIIARIRKMLRLANDAGASEGERDNALRMAHATLAKYNLDLAALEEAEPTKESSEPRTEEEIRFTAERWASHVAASVGRLFMCKTLVRRSPATHYFIGRHSNAVTASLIAQFLVKAIAREAACYQRYRHDVPGLKRSFAYGAASRINERVRELLRSSSEQKSDIKTSRGKALVLVDLYRQEELCNEGFMLVRYPQLRSQLEGRGRSRSPDPVDRFAFDAGSTYANQLSLHRQVKGRAP